MGDVKTEKYVAASVNSSKANSLCRMSPSPTAVILWASLAL